MTAPGASALEASVTLDDVFLVVCAKRVPMAPELAGYLVLEIAEHADPSGGDVDPKSVFVGEEGTVALVRPKRQGATGDAEVSIRAALARLLDASGSQTPALTATSRRKSGTGLPALAEELEAALIPVNRAAGRRALARLVREVKRVTLGVGRNALPSSSDAGPGGRRALTSSAGLGDTPPPPRSTDPLCLLPDAASPSDLRGGRAGQADVAALVEEFEVSGGGEPQHARSLRAMADVAPTPAPPPADVEPRGVGEAKVLAPTGDPDRARKDIDERPLGPGDLWSERSIPAGRPAARREPPRKGGDKPGPLLPPWRKQPTWGGASKALPVLALGLVAIVAGALAVRTLRPAANGHEEASAGSARGANVAVASSVCRGLLVVNDVPPHAEVLLGKGQAPVDVERMPVGRRLEFVATAEGYAPKRVVVPAGAPWDPDAQGRPRYEAAVQLDKSLPGASDPWPPGEPGSEVGGEGPPGTVRVVATPRGAQVWMLAGIGPEARIELPCDRDVDVLVAGPTTFRRRLHVTAGDFLPEEASSAAATTGAPPERQSVAHVSAK